MKNAAVGGNGPPNRWNLRGVPQVGPCITRLVLSPVTTGSTHIPRRRATDNPRAPASNIRPALGTRVGVTVEPAVHI
jgi:hypothetical protein